MNDRLLGALQIAVSAASFGAMAIFARLAREAEVDVTAVLFLRFTIAAVLMAAWMQLSGRRWPRGRSLVTLVVMGALAYVGQAYCFFSALDHASAGLVALLLYLYPFLVTVLGALCLRQRLDKGRVLAVIAALAGTALTLGGGLAGEPLGVGLSLAAALIYSIYILAGSRVLASEDPVAAATVVMIAAALVFGGLSWQAEPRFPHDARGWMAVAAIALVSTVVAMVSFFAGLARLGAADAATLSTLEPVVTIGLAALYLGEPLSLQQLAGGAIILSAGIWLARRSAPEAGRA